MRADLPRAPKNYTSEMPSSSVDTIEYRRVSTTEQAADEKSSLSDQGAANAALASKLGRRIGQTFDDPGFSGGTADRPGFQRMVVYCEEHPRDRREKGFLLMLNASRFGRFGPDQHAYWRERLKNAGWLVRFAEGDDIENPSGRAIMRTINAVQAQEYRDNLSANSRRGKRGAATRGYWVSKAPFGYRRQVVQPPERWRTLENGVPKAQDELVKLAFGPSREARMVRWIFDAYDSGRHSITTITRRLQGLGTRLRWSRTSVHHLLANPAYAGEVRGGRIRHDRDADDFVWKRDPSAWYGMRDAHPALVSRESFDRVQRRLALQQGRTTSPQTAYVLSGLIACAICGEPYVGGGGGRNPQKHGEFYRFYKDRGGNEPKKCDGRIGTVSKHILEGAVITAIAEEVERPNVQAVILEELDRLIEATDGGSKSTARALDAERRMIERKRANLVDAIANGTVQQEEAATALSRLRAGLADLDEQRDRARFAGRTQNRLRDERDNIMALASQFTERLKGLPGAAQRELIAPWIDGAAFDKTTRSLRLTVRVVPMTDVFLLSSSPETDLP